MNQAPEISFNDIKHLDVIIIKLRGFYTPVKVVRVSASNIWYSHLYFINAFYENENQCGAFRVYADNSFEQFRLSKTNTKIKIFKIEYDEDTSEIQHRADSLYYTCSKAPPNA